MTKKKLSQTEQQNLVKVSDTKHVMGISLRNFYGRLCSAMLVHSAHP